MSRQSMQDGEPALFRTTPARQRSKNAQTDEHAAAETPADAANKAAAQCSRRRPHGQSVSAVGDRGDCHEKKTERHALKHGRRIGAQKLRQKSGKENRRLGVEQSHHETVTEDAPKHGTAAGISAGYDR